MVLAEQCAKSLGITQGDGSSEDTEKTEKEAVGSVTAHEPKPRASGKAASKRKGNQPEKHHGRGELSLLPDIPLDVLYEVSPRIDSVTDDGWITTPLVFADICFHPPDGSTTGVMDQQGFP